MKLFFTLLCLIVCTAVQSQTGFAPVGATWYYSVGAAFSPPSCLKIAVEKDTVVQGQPCRKLVKNQTIACAWAQNLVEFVYEADSAVYFFDFNFQAFHLLYDFKLQAGDSWKIPWQVHCEPPWCTEPVTDTLVVVVDAVTQVQINGQWLKRQHVHGFPVLGAEPDAYFEGFIIEKLGFDRYLFLNLYADLIPIICEGNLPFGLQAYENTDLGFYEPDIFVASDSCEFLVATNVPSRPAPIHLFPNPVSDRFTITSNHDAEMTYELHNPIGQILKRDVFRQSRQVDVSNLPAGIYFLHFFREGACIAMKKVVKQ
ncbi:MAG: T9SS type A sorting domain-containing protein [Saprospiraceae bacterium]|nr:T9SS type A sorting domain-containing protein [Saprospiraceae bacterium]MDZ4702898.1 T9SS type A sorting domain-containing protein [Saprospiraceae bacterium]